VALLDGLIVGFASLDSTGYLDFMYVHHACQSKGVATFLLKVILLRASALDMPHIVVDASITSRPFFEHKGFSLVRTQEVLVKGVHLTNYHMILQGPFMIQ
jgi:putative acetyltransferase